MSQIISSDKQQNMAIKKALLDALSAAIGPDKKVLIIIDAGFQNACFQHIKSLGWDFIGRVRGNVQLRLVKKSELWFRREELQASSKPEYLGP